MVTIKHGKHVKKRLSNVGWRLRVYQVLQNLEFHGFGKLETNRLLSVVLCLGRKKIDINR